MIKVLRDKMPLIFIKFESAKLCAMSAIRAYVFCVLSCFACLSCLRALRAYVLCVLTCLRGLRALRAYVPPKFACLRALRYLLFQNLRASTTPQRVIRIPPRSNPETLIMSPLN